ncbi:skin secretory protein xP2 [Anthonomus grandis grandis]|uniref:skin secretory protein xP2 n=1 Tax=Anthonomus grandis grandis TaxID=2921223 RepID=UPI0021669CAE|nr:skin secretory protein xP2 [Anthonomus grandis grandis]
MFRYVAVIALVASSLAQDFDYDQPRPAPARVKPNYSGPQQSNAPRVAPVAIIKQIDRHNDDGSYTYGYESADGSFKIETKAPTGEVRGKYGYVDDLGKMRVIEYGATKHGFAPAGEGITVPPPTLVDETTDKTGNLLPEYSGAYDQGNNDPEPVRTQQSYNRPRPIELASNSFSSNFGSASAAPAPRPAPRPAPLEYSPPQTFEPAPRPAPARPAQAAPAPNPQSYTVDFPNSNVPSRPAFAPAPVPARPAFSNAAPAPVDLGIPTRAAPPPRPQQSFAPAPVSRPAPQYRPQPSAGRASGGSILDQLSKDYALPQGNANPVHDISFGFF